MDCTNHPGWPASGRCAGCAEAYCEYCLVEVLGQTYCGACKSMALQGLPLSYEGATIPCKEAGEAMTFTIVGVFVSSLTAFLGLIGLILCIVGIVKAIQARTPLARDARLTGAGKANAAIVMGSIGIVLYLLNLVATASHS